MRYLRCSSNEFTSPSDSGREGRLDSSDDDGRVWDSSDCLSREDAWRDEGRVKGFILWKMSILKECLSREGE